MPDEKDWGPNHWERLVARISDNVNLNDVDQVVLQQVSEYVKDSPTETEKAQRIIMFQILGEGTYPVTYEHFKSMGHLGKDITTKLIFLSNKEEAYFDNDLKDVIQNPECFRIIHAKTHVEFGYLVIDYAGRYSISFKSPKIYDGRGFRLQIWNNCQASITREDMEKMMGRVTDVILKKYSRVVDVVGLYFI